MEMNMQTEPKHHEAVWTGILPSGRMLRPADVVERTGLSRSQIYQMISDGNFPPFIKLSTRASALPESWLDAFVETRAAATLRKQKEPKALGWR